MSSSASPFGLRPSFKEGGQVASCTLNLSIASGYNTAIFLYSPVKIAADGTLQAAAAGDAFVGSFMGVEYTDPVTGRRMEMNQWPAGQVANDIVAYYTKEPYLTYEIQANGSLDQTSVGAQYDTTAVSGNTSTGLSTTSLDTASGAASAQMRVVGLTPGPDNAWGDSFTIVQVQVSDHQYVATRNAF